MYKLLQIANVWLSHCNLWGGKKLEFATELTAIHQYIKYHVNDIKFEANTQNKEYEFNKCEYSST
jgi:hypothetical protein